MTPDFETPLPRRRCGVYHLVRDGAVLYVGQSRNLLNRISGHDFTEYDTVRFFYCEPEELDILELNHIATLRPPLNRRGVDLVFMSGRGPFKTLFCPVALEGARDAS